MELIIFLQVFRQFSVHRKLGLHSFEIQRAEGLHWMRSSEEEWWEMDPGYDKPLRKPTNVRLGGSIYQALYFCAILVPWPAWPPVSIQHIESGLLCILTQYLNYFKHWIWPVGYSICPLSGVSLCHHSWYLNSSHRMSVLRKILNTSNPWKLIGYHDPVCNYYFIPFIPTYTLVESNI